MTTVQVLCAVVIALVVVALTIRTRLRASRVRFERSFEELAQLGRERSAQRAELLQIGAELQASRARVDQLLDRAQGRRGGGKRGVSTEVERYAPLPVVRYHVTPDASSLAPEPAIERALLPPPSLVPQRFIELCNVGVPFSALATYGEIDDFNGGLGDWVPALSKDALSILGIWASRADDRIIQAFLLPPVPAAERKYA